MSTLDTMIATITSAIQSKLASRLTTYVETERRLTEFPVAIIELQGFRPRFLTISRDFEITLTYSIYIVTQKDDPEQAFNELLSYVGDIMADLENDHTLGGNCLDSHVIDVNFQYLERAQLTRHQARILFEVLIVWRP